MTDSPQTLLLAGSVEILAAGSDGPAKAPRVSVLAYGGGLMTVAPWGPVVVDLAGLEIPERLALLSDHDDQLGGIIGSGVPTKAGGKLLVDGALVAGDTAVDRIIQLSKAGTPFGASIGMRVTHSDPIKAGETVTANGQTFKAPPGGFTLIRRGRLVEVSILAVGADAGTQVTIAAKAADKTQASTSARGGQRTMSTEIDNATARERIETVWNQATFHDANLRAKAHSAMLAAVAGEVDFVTFEADLLRAQLNDSELHQLRASFPTGPAIHASTRDVGSAVLEASFCKSAGLRNLEATFKPEVLEAADKYGSIGLQELLLCGASSAGWQGRNRITVGNLRDVLGHALPGRPLQAAGGASTIDVAGILSNTANKILVQAFDSVETVYRQISRPRPVNDFKENTFYRLTSSLEYEQVPASGAIPEGTLGEESYTASIKTYAKLLALSRTQIINDDLGAFDTLRSALGRGAALKINKVFWNCWLDDAAFFSGAHANLCTGSGSALEEDGVALTDAAIKFALLTDADGAPTGLQPRLLLCPPELGSIARRFFVSQEIRDNTVSTRLPVGNVFQSRFKPIESSYLSASGITGSSSTGWYLLVDPVESGIAPIDILYLDGQESPVIESTDADFDTLGIQFRGYHDFGVALSEFRAAVKCEGA
jgi:hypothetical protein